MASTSNIRQLFPASAVLLDKESEKKLVTACLQGDRSAMEALVKHYERPVYNAAYRMLGSPDDAADVTQDTFLKAFSKLTQYNPEFRFFSWIYRIAMNESIDMLKHRRPSVNRRDELPSDEPGPADVTDSVQTSNELRIAMLDLTEEYRAVIVLKYFTGLSYDEMARVLGVPEKTVKSRLYSARQNLSVALKQRGFLQS